MLFFESFCCGTVIRFPRVTFIKQKRKTENSHQHPKRKYNDVEMTRRTICLELCVLDFDEDDEDGDTNNHGMLMFE